MAQAPLILIQHLQAWPLKSAIYSPYYRTGTICLADMNNSGALLICNFINIVCRQLNCLFSEFFTKMRRIFRPKTLWT